MHEQRETRPSRVLMTSLALFLAAAIAGAADLRSFSNKFKQNRQELREYRWKSRVEMLLEGRAETVQVFDVSHDSDGLLHKAPIPAEQDGKKITKKQRQLLALQVDLQALIDAYLEPDERTAEQYFDRSAVWQGQGRVDGETHLKARNVRRQSDEVSLWLDSETGVPRELLIVTSDGGEPVRVTTEFAQLEAGPFFPASVVVETEIKEKKVVMRAKNYDFTR
jgi:hypothetical protein